MAGLRWDEGLVVSNESRQNVIANTSASRIKNVRRKYIDALIVSINDRPVFMAKSAFDALHAVASSDDETFRIVFASDRYIWCNSCCAAGCKRPPNKVIIAKDSDMEIISFNVSTPMSE